MTQQGFPSDGEESIDPRHFARRARIDDDDDESVAVVSRTSSPKIGSADVDTNSPRGGAESDRTAKVNQSFAEIRTQKLSILAEQREDWERGRPAPIEDLFQRWPISPSTDPDAASLLIEDYFQRRKRDDTPTLDDYRERFPDQSQSLLSLVSRRNVFRDLDATGPNQAVSLRLPDVGDEVFGFRLKLALGRGAFARVFLAGQGHLAGRPVVLKVSAIEGTEPQTLAQLQHTNIVPIYSVHEDPQAALRAVCMPYLGGASLSCVLKELFASAPCPLEGSQFVKALETVQAPLPEMAGNQSHEAATQSGQSPLATLAGLDYPRAAIWVAARLAEGLQHAHQRGVLHRDIKPSNILISSEGQPLHLDFNLAHDRNLNPVSASIGGTIAYMAPEHLLAILKQTPEQAKLVDHRSDIYSLGMVIAEMLTGHNPFEQSASYSAFPLQIEAMAVDRGKLAPSVHALRPDIPWGLESIVRTCLDPNPDRRYQKAEDLAEDLRRLLDDRPLLHAPELSFRERCRKWTRRHPRLTAAGSVAMVATAALLLMGTAYVGVSRHLNQTRTHLGVFESRDRLAAHDAGTSEALTLVNTVIERADLVRKGLEICEKTLALYDSSPGSAGSAEADWARLTAEERNRVAEDRRELLLLAAGARLLLAPGDSSAVREALQNLEKAEAIPGLPPSRALWNDRARYLALLGDTKGASSARQRAEVTLAQTARDHYLLATSYARGGGAGSYDRAIEELNQAIRMNPRHYWSLVLRGVCFLEKGDFVSSAGDFGLCAGLRPDLVWGYFNRGYVYDRGGRKAEAVEDYTMAIARDPRFVPARINRGMALLQLRRYADALTDFQAAKTLGGSENDSTLSAGIGMALEGLRRHKEADAAFERVFADESTSAAPERVRLLWTYGFAISERLPSKADAAFREVLRMEPSQPQALYGLAMLAMSAGRDSEALTFFDKAVKVAPDFVEARRYRAIVLARAAAWEQASRDIHWCLEREPTSGDTLYAAACVSSRAAAKIGTPQTIKQTLDLLRKALEQGVGRDKFARDPDLEGMRNQPEFRRLVNRYASESNPRKAF